MAEEYRGLIHMLPKLLHYKNLYCYKNKNKIKINTKTGCRTVAVQYRGAK
jgi:hypothetical protein